MSTIIVKYNLEDTVYFTIKSKVDIFKATVTKVYPSISGNKYRVSLEDPNELGHLYLDYVEESALLQTFEEARAELLVWLNSKITEVTNLVEV